MNYEDRRLIRTLIGILTAIEQNTHRIPDQERSERNQEQPPQRVNLQSEIRLDPAIRDHYEAENRERPSKNKRDLIRLILEGATLVAAILAAIFTGFTLNEFRKQTPEFKKSADAAASAAKTANIGLHVSERAYLSIETPILDEQSGSVDFGIDNNGRLPAASLNGILYEKTCNAIVDVPPGMAPQEGMIDCPEHHRTNITWPSIAPGPGNARTLVPLPAFSRSKIDVGKQAIEISGTFKYGDGFSDDKIQESAFCFQTTYHLVTRKLYWGACDPTKAIARMEALENRQHK